MRHYLLCAFASLCLLLTSATETLALPATLSATRPTPGYVRVKIVTTEGAILVAVDTRKAPKTAANFLAYVDDERFVGTTFYRAARRKSDPKYGLIQGGIDMDMRRSLAPIPIEMTSQTGIKHLDATISMARNANPNSAMGNFFITIGDAPNMDSRGAYQGYAAFGHVIGGMKVVRKILAKPSGGGRGVMRGQMILKPVSIIRTERLDGKAKPTPGSRPWK